MPEYNDVRGIASVLTGINVAGGLAGDGADARARHRASMLAR
jgi:hypothetical protein